MTKKSFATMMLLMLGDISLILGIILLCSDMGYLGMATMALGAVLIIAAIAVGRKKSADAKKFSAGKFFKVLAIITVSVILHAVGVILMRNVNLVAGVAAMLIAVVNLMFIIPATKGFKKDE